MSDHYATGSPVHAVVVARPAWQADAACHEHTEVDFFAESVDRARSVCERCLVKRECLAFRHRDAHRVRRVRGDDAR